MIQDILEQKYGEYLKDLWISENRTSLRLSAIIIKDEYKNTGVGTKIMNDLIDYAEKNTQIIVLTPSSDYGGSKNRLIQFYKRFGFKHNKGVHKNFEYQDAMIRYPRKMHEGKKDKLKGGHADNMSVKDIANKFNVTINKIEQELKKGIEVEMEHSKSRKLSKEIAMDHLVEIPDYYTRLNKMEKEGKRKWDVKESRKDNIKRLIREHINLEVTDETPDVSTYAIKHNERYVGQIAIAPVSGENNDNTMEIVSIVLNPREEFQKMKIINEVITALWGEFEGVQRFLLTPMPESKTFWHKMGATRLNDDFLMLNRGH